MREDFDEKEYAKFDDWCDRKIAEKEAKRRGAGEGGDCRQSGTAHIEHGSGCTSKDRTEVTSLALTPASLTSDPKYEEQF